MPLPVWLMKCFDWLASAGALRPAREERAECLPAVIRELERLNQASERDFLRVGEKLMEIRAAAQRISSQMAALGEMVSGPAGREASGALDAMLEDSQAVDRRAGKSGQALAAVLDLSSRLRRAFSGLPNTVALFRTICTLTRIETTRLGGVGVDFGNLAEEVKPLSERIQSSGEGVLQTAAELDRGVQSALRHGKELQASELKNLQAMAQEVMDGLHAFEQQRQRARAASEAQAAQYAAVCEAIDDLVRSIQFHDITRQQVEHVMQALRQISSGGSEGTFTGATIAAGRAAILSLQDSQLAEAARVFANCVASIERDLPAISGRLRDMAAASRDLAGLSPGGQDSFFVNMEGSLTSILEAAGACGKTEAEMRALAADLHVLIERMRQSILDIRGTEISIERIAINATIHATQIGEPGDALNVVAERMRLLAIDSNRSTEDAGALLDSMLAVVDGLDCESGAQDETMRADPEAVNARTRAALEDLHASSESSLRQVQEIAALGSRLAEDVDTAGQDFEPGRLFAATMDHVRAELARLGAQAVPSNDGDREARARHLEQFAAGYTMERQREIHASVVAGSAPAEGTSQTVATVVGEGNLGENVELF